MRSIKFRAWITEPKELDFYMAYFDLLSEDNRWIKEKNAPIMQFTGLLDKNGVEIYEGDILDTPNGKMKVFWDEKLFCWEMEDAYGSWWPINWYKDSNKIEVIGNIYQNPELFPPTIVDKGEK